MCRLTDSKEEERNYGLDILRIMASFFVVQLHVAACLYADENVRSTLFCAEAFYQTIGRVAVPIFVMLSGAFFLDPQKNFSAKKFATKNLMHLIVSFLFWGILYAAYDWIINGAVFSLNSAVSFVFTVLKGYHHLWFLPMMIGLYLIVPFLRLICQSETWMRYFLALSFLFCFVAKLIEKIPLADSYVFPIIDGFELRFVTGFTGYFVLGYYIRSHAFSMKKRLFVYGAGIFCAICTIACLYILSFRAQEMRSTMNNYLFPNVLIWSAALFLAGKQINDRITFSDSARKVLASWSSLTFGVYLSHMFVVYAIGKVFPVIQLPFLTIPMISVACYVLSLAVTYGIKKIPVLNRYVV